MKESKRTAPLRKSTECAAHVTSMGVRDSKRLERQPPGGGAVDLEVRFAGFAGMEDEDGFGGFSCGSKHGARVTW